jgi:hypothetical protein
MKSDCELRLHSLIDVHIKLPPPSPRVYIVKAHVSRKLEECVGIEWCEFGPAVVLAARMSSAGRGRSAIWRSFAEAAGRIPF